MVVPGQHFALPGTIRPITCFRLAEHTEGRALGVGCDHRQNLGRLGLAGGGDARHLPGRIGRRDVGIEPRG
jgi:hypothetical protein